MTSNSERSNRDAWPVSTRAALGVLVAAALIVTTWLIARQVVVPNYAQLRRDHGALLAQNAAIQADRETLERRVARLQRALEISDGARGKLREDLSRQHGEIASLRADLTFYQGLVGQGGEREGLGAHRVRIEPTSSPEVYRLSVTLAQNIRRAKMVSGTMRLNVEGVFEDYPERLSWQVINAGAPIEGFPFRFRYFQEIDGTISLPPGFAPERLLVLISAPKASTEEEVAAVDWSEALKSGDDDITQESV